MIIGIDGNEANVEKKVGISEYVWELLKQFRKNKVKGLKFKVYLKDCPRGELPKEKEGWEYRLVKPRRLWTQFGLPIELRFRRPRPDVFFSPNHYAPRFSPIPTAISIMDLSFVFYPELFRRQDLYQLLSWTAYSVKGAKKIFTISKASKDDIIRLYKVNADKVVVTYPGIKLFTKGQISNMQGVKEKYGINKDYILFVGTLQPRKNISRLIEAFSILLKKTKKDKLMLVMVGKKGWLYEEILAAPQKFSVTDNVRFLEYVPEQDLFVLYKEALFFVLPSLYEGFGLPVLEAMSIGCPVITSNVSSLPEVGGEAVLYVDPKNVGDIAAKMEKLVSDDKLRETLRESGYKQAKKFSWEKTARETLAVLENIARSDKP